jgi:Leucine-rich repeat (LRR) protein
MEKFNKKTLIIGLLIFIGLLILAVTTFAQTNVGSKDLNPPSNLIANVEDENDVNLFWNQPSSGDSTYLHWDSGENEDSFGNFLNPVTYLFASKYDPVHIEAYDGWNITQLRFWISNPLPTVKIKVWTGPDATEIYSQDVHTFNVNDWTEIDFDIPVTIDASTELWVGLYVDMPVPGPVMGTDSGPAIDGYGNMYNLYGTWYHDFDLNWNIQALIEEPAPPVSLHWDSGENNDSWGFFLGSAQFDAAAKWDPVHIEAYDNWQITEMRFWITNPMPTIQLKIWSGPDATEIYSQDISSFNVNDWTEVTLDNPVTIDANTQLWAGLYVDMPVAGAVMGLDEGPAIDGYGNMYKYFGTWYSDVSGNWNIQITVENPDAKGIDGLLGYNVFRNGDQINEDTWGSTAFVDENLLNGTYNYYVTAVYDEGESDPSNTVEVIIAQPVIAFADSMALVDLYNNCNGPNWALNDYWLEGPVNEWYGVVTEGTRVTQLWRQSNNLTGDIPESIGNLTALEKLHLESNQITSMPESIGNLTALTELWLGWTPITIIPGSIGNLINLEQLHLGSMVNPLGTLPDEICNLESLEWLALGGSGLNSLPENFGNLTSVESCFLWGNNLTELPAGFGGMENLNYLSLDDNQLTTLPDSFGDLDNLSRLFIENNQLTHFPESFGDLESLDSLWVRWNQINVLPESFGNLADLNYLRMTGNNLTELPASFTDLATLEELYLFNNQLEYLPEDLGNLNTLFFLDVGANNIDEIPESIGELVALNIFAANGNNLTAIPESFGNLEPDSVFIHDNQITELPVSLFDNSFDIFVIQENNLQFGSIEPFMDNNIELFYYGLQAMIGQDTVLEVVNNESLSYSIEVSGENNIYTWYKEGVLLLDQTTNTLYLENASYDDQGTYVLKVTNTIVPDLELVSYDAELSIITGGVQTINLVTGYQFVSSRFIPENPDMLVVVEEILNENLDFVRNSAGQMLRKIGPVWVNGIGNWIVEQGYLVKMFAADSFTICGEPVTPGTPIDVELGFQFVSYFPAAPMDALVAFETIVGDDLDFIRNSAGQMLRKIGPVWVNGIGDCNPGEGYLIKMFADGEIIYPALAKSSGKIPSVPTYFTFEGGNAADPVYTLYLKGLEIGDEVAAYDGDIMLGATKINSQNAFENELPVFSTLINGQGYEVGNLIILKVWSGNTVVSTDFAMESIYNSYVSKVYPGNDGEFSIVKVNKSTSVTNSELEIYPNPATNLINIISQIEIINIKVYNHVGQSVYEAGVNNLNVQINTNNFESGVYIVKIETCKGIETQKFIIK